MSLSKACLNQYAKENAITKKWLFRGLLIAAGAHLGLIPLMAFVPAKVIAPPERIALVVTGPTEPIDAVPEETLAKSLPEESIEALERAIAQAELAAEAQVSGGSSSAPPPPIASFQPAPQPVPESSPAPAEAEPIAEEPDITEPDITEPDMPESEVPESEADEPSVNPETEATTEAAEDPSLETEPEDAEVASPSELDQPDSDSKESDSEEPVETAANNANTDAPDLDALRDRLSRARESQGNNENASDRDAGETPAANTGRGDDGSDVARRDGPSEGDGSGNGNGDGDSSGSNTVSCRKCDRPAYPAAALEEGIEGSPSVSLEYDENGKVIGAVLEQSSGNAALDQAALEAARSYELDSGGRGGSVSVEIDFGIEGSERSRTAQQRGERESVTAPSPEPAAPAVVQEPALEPAPSEPVITDIPPVTIPTEQPATSEPPEPYVPPEPAPYVPPEPAPVEAAPEPYVPPEPAPYVPPEPAPVEAAPEPYVPPEPTPAAPAVPDIMSTE